MGQHMIFECLLQVALAQRRNSEKSEGLEKWLYDTEKEMFCYREAGNFCGTSLGNKLSLMLALLPEDIRRLNIKHWTWVSEICSWWPARNFLISLLRGMVFWSSVTTNMSKVPWLLTLSALPMLPKGTIMALNLAAKRLGRTRANLWKHVKTMKVAYWPSTMSHQDLTHQSQVLLVYFLHVPRFLQPALALQFQTFWWYAARSKLQARSPSAMAKSAGTFACLQLASNTLRKNWFVGKISPRIWYEPSINIQIRSTSLLAHDTLHERHREKEGWPESNNEMSLPHTKQTKQLDYN